MDRIAGCWDAWLTLSLQQALASLRQSQRDPWAFLGVSSVQLPRMWTLGCCGEKLDTSHPGVTESYLSLPGLRWDVRGHGGPCPAPIPSVMTKRREMAIRSVSSKYTEHRHRGATSDILGKKSRQNSFPWFLSLDLRSFLTLQHNSSLLMLTQSLESQELLT